MCITIADSVYRSIISRCSAGVEVGNLRVNSTDFVWWERSPSLTVPQDLFAEELCLCSAEFEIMRVKCAESFAERERSPYLTIVRKLKLIERSICRVCVESLPQRMLPKCIYPSMTSNANPMPCLFPYDTNILTHSLTISKPLHLYQHLPETDQQSPSLPSPSPSQYPPHALAQPYHTKSPFLPRHSASHHFPSNLEEYTR